MAKKRFTVVINGEGGYSHYRIKATDWKKAGEIAYQLHRAENPNEPVHEIGTAAIVAGWPDIWC